MIVVVIMLVKLVPEMEVDYGRLEQNMLHRDDEGLERMENVGGIFLCSVLLVR